MYFVYVETKWFTVNKCTKPWILIDCIGSKFSKVSEDIRLFKPYTTSKAYNQNAFGPRTAFLSTQDNPLMHRIKILLRLQLLTSQIKICLNAYH